MNDCWHSDPRARPAFDIMHAQLVQMQETYRQQAYGAAREEMEMTAGDGPQTRLRNFDHDPDQLNSYISLESLSEPLMRDDREQFFSCK